MTADVDVLQAEPPPEASRPRKYTPEFRRQMAEAFQAAPNRKVFAQQAGIDGTTLRSWAASPHLTDPKLASGRASEFRMHEGTLEQLGPDNQWHRYVPFRELQQMLGRPWRQDKPMAREHKPKLPAPAPPEDVPRLKDTQEMPAVQLPAPPATEGGHMDMQVRAADRLAQISKRQMARAMALPTRASPEEERTAMQTAHESNGVTKKGTRKLYTEEEKADLAARFRAAPDKKAFAEESGVASSLLFKWSAERFGPGTRGPKTEAKPAPTPPVPAKPAAPRTARAQPPAVDRDFTRELDVLRQLLELPADARERIVAYLTSRGRG